MTSVDPFVDNATLMAALFHAQSRTTALGDFVINTPYFQEIEENEMVKSKLVDFLNADRAFRKASTDHQALSWTVRKNPLSKVRRVHEERLDDLRNKLSQAFKELEMIRKLALPANTLLQVRPYVYAS